MGNAGERLSTATNSSWVTALVLLIRVLDVESWGAKNASHAARTQGVLSVTKLRFLRHEWRSHDGKVTVHGIWIPSGESTHINRMCPIHDPAGLINGARCIIDAGSRMNGSDLSHGSRDPSWTGAPSNGYHVMDAARARIR